VRFLVHEFHEFLKRQSEVEERAGGEASASGETSWPKLRAASKASIARKIKELATYTHCNEEGAMKGKRCWVVPQDKREQYGLADLKLPNRWKFILKRPRLENKVSGLKAAGLKAAGLEPSPTAEPAHPLETPSPSVRKSLITNFTKVMTEEEKQLDWER